MGWIEDEGPAPADTAAAAGAARAMLRIGHGGEDAFMTEAAAAAAALCEAFTGRMLTARAIAETLPGTSGWQRLGRGPVRAITGVAQVAADGSAAALAADAYQIDIDAAGDGWVRIEGQAPGGRIRVDYAAGIAPSWGEVPDALRHGVARMAAHLFAGREAGTAAPPPAAVSALWRPYRRVRL